MGKHVNHVSDSIILFKKEQKKNPNYYLHFSWRIGKHILYMYLRFESWIHYILLSACPHGFFGPDCAERCNDTCNGCNNVNGICDSGCNSGWRGYDCQDGNGKYVHTLCIFVVMDILNNNLNTYIYLEFVRCEAKYNVPKVKPSWYFFAFTSLRWRIIWW